MASLTPGVLSKLLQNAGNREVKVTGSDHRSALLQVIEIVPKSTDDDDHPWQSRGGFFLKLSDSLHSAYVSVSDDDADFIFADKIQLGQFVYVARLHSGSPVPVLRGLKPVPRRPPCPCVGNPTDLVSSDFLPIAPNVGFSKPSKASKANFKKSDVGNGKVVEGLELRRLSLDSARKVWDQRPTPKISAAVRPTWHSKSKPTSTFSRSPSGLSDKKAFPKNDSSLKCPSLSISPLKNKGESCTPKSITKSLKNDFNSLSRNAIPSQLVKVPLSLKTWSDQRISWDMVPPRFHDLGKEAASHKNAAFLAAVHALEEASAAEAVIRCMCTFAELCNSTQKLSAGPLVEQFLTLHQSMQRAERLVNSLLHTGLHEAKTSTCSLPHSIQDTCKSFTNKNAAISWVQAAIETDLSNFFLFRKQEKSEIPNGNCHYVVLENPPKETNSENTSPHNKRSPKKPEGHIPDSNVKLLPSSRRHLSATKKMNNERDCRTKGSGLTEAASLVQKLLTVSREWFLKYLEDSLNMKFGLCRGDGSSEIASLLRQLKRVNQYLDDFVGGGVGDDETERIEDLRKKLYEFLLEHVNSAVAAAN